MNRNNIPPPPVPQFLRETLKDYPELLQELQRRMNLVVAEFLQRKWGTPFIEVSETVEDALSAFYSDASEALQAAEQTGDSLLIYRAKIKYDALVDARRGPSLDELRDYFQTYKGAFE